MSGELSSTGGFTFKVLCGLAVLQYVSPRTEHAVYMDVTLSFLSLNELFTTMNRWDYDQVQTSNAIVDALTELVGAHIIDIHLDLGLIVIRCVSAEDVGYVYNLIESALSQH